MPLVVLAELEIPFKDKLVTEKTQQRRHASTLLSVQTLQAQGEILGSSEWVPQLRARKTPSWTGPPQTQSRQLQQWSGSHVGDGLPCRAFYLPYE